jgi:hypothetical protein
MNEPAITVRLDGNRRNYLPHEQLCGEFRLEGVEQEEIRSLELSVLWYSEGKGDEDLGVHYFEAVEAADAEAQQLLQPHRFSTHLPESPLSYEGRIVKIRWCVRVRLFLPRGKTVVCEEPFRLGNVPPPQADAT